jgi:hypothetical protein
MSRILETKTRASRVVGAGALALLAFLHTAEAAETNVFLGRARNFAVLAGSSINNTGQTIVGGSIGVAPGTSVAGFARSAVQVNTRAATNAQFDLTAAYDEAASRSNATAFPGTASVTPGLYRTSALTVPSGGLVLDAQGNPAAVFVFQIDSTLTVPAGSGVFLAGAARAANIFWQVGDSANIGANAMMNGTIMANQTITMGSRATLDGRALARNGDVILDRNVISLPTGGTTNDVPLNVVVLTPISFDLQTGLFEQRVRVSNVGTGTNAFRGVAAFIRGLPGDVRVYNGLGSTSSPLVTHDFPVASGQSVDFVIEYYRTNRQIFTQPVYSPTITIPGSSNPDGRIFSIDQAQLVQVNRMLIEFTAEAGKRYLVQYRDDVTSAAWRSAHPAVTAGANRVQWFDDGPPKTESPPGPVGNRFYRVVELP